MVRKQSKSDALFVSILLSYVNINLNIKKLINFQSKTTYILIRIHLAWKAIYFGNNLYSRSEVSD